MSSLRSWSAKKKTGTDITTVEEFTAPEDETKLRSWANTSKVAPESNTDAIVKETMVLSALGTDHLSHENLFTETGSSKIKDKVVHNVNKIKKGKESWSKVRDAHKKGVKMFAKKRNISNVIQNHKHSRDRTHGITEKIDEIRIMQAGKMKEKQDVQKEKETLRSALYSWAGE